MGYYYETAATGVPEVDAIGSAVDRAGKAYHHTERWTEQDSEGRCVVDDIDDALKACAARIAALEAEVARVRDQLAKAHTALAHVRQQAGLWKQEARTQKHTVDGVGEVLGGIPDYGPIVAGVDALRQRAEAAERDARRYRDAVEAFVAWLNAEDSGANYEGLTRATHPNGEAIWRAWYDDNITLCDRALTMGRAALTPQPEANDA